jgi:hypothetical protein
MRVHIAIQWHSHPLGQPQITIALAVLLSVVTLAMVHRSMTIKCLFRLPSMVATQEFTYENIENEWPIYLRGLEWCWFCPLLAA